MKKLILLLFIFAIEIFLSVGLKAANFDSTFAEQLQQRINLLKTNNNLVGISAAAYVPGQGMWTGSYGISSSDSDKITTEMVLNSGSVAKNFMATIILMLAEADSLNLSDTLGQWLSPYNNIPGNITIKQLLDHSSGIYNVTDNPAFISAINSNLNRLWTIEEVLKGGYILSPYFLPGAAFRYSNTNYMILGLIIKKIMKTTLAEQFKERFFKPFSLNETYFEFDDTVKSPFAHNWADFTGSGVRQDAFHIPTTSINSSTIGAGGVISRPENMVRWLIALFEGHILNANSMTQMLTFRNVSIAGGNGYGLGVIRYNVPGNVCYGHGGNIFGYSTVAIYDPVDSISIAVMINNDVNAGPIGINFMSFVKQNNPVSISEISGVIPEKYTLEQNYPNPFNPVTNINFSIPHRSFVKITVFDILGKEIQNLINEELNEGNFKIDFNGSSLPSGIYFYKIETNDFVQVRKMTLLK